MSEIDVSKLFQGQAHRPKDSKLNRDTRLLNGEISFEEQRKIDKAWTRARTLGLLGLLEVNARRDKKRGFEL